MTQYTPEHLVDLISRLSKTWSAPAATIHEAILILQSMASEIQDLEDEVREAKLCHYCQDKIGDKKDTQGRWICGLCAEEELLEVTGPVLPSDHLWGVGTSSIVLTKEELQSINSVRSVEPRLPTRPVPVYDHKGELLGVSIVTDPEP